VDGGFFAAGMLAVLGLRVRMFVSEFALVRAGFAPGARSRSCSCWRCWPSASSACSAI